MKRKNKLLCIFIFLFILLPLSCLSQPHKIAGLGKLILAVEVIRHGDRTPLHTLKSPPVIWQQGLGQLTSVGLQETFLLGQQFHRSFIIKNKLLAPYYLSSVVYIRSLDLDRTLLSAESVSLGLFPPGTGPILPDSGEPALPYKIQLVPVHTVSIQKDTLLHAYDLCPRYEELVDEKIYHSKVFQEKEKQTAAEIAKWNQLAGTNVTLKTVSQLADPINVRLIHNRSLPKEISQKDAEKIISLANWVKTLKYRNRKLDKLAGGNLLKKILSDLKEKIQDKSPLKFILYSASDNNILALLGAMNLAQDKNPPYASHVDIWLWKNKEKQFQVTLRYNNTKLTVPGCAQTCPFNRFAQLMQSGYVDNWKKACQPSSPLMAFRKEKLFFRHAMILQDIAGLAIQIFANSV